MEVLEAREHSRLLCNLVRGDDERRYVQTSSSLLTPQLHINNAWMCIEIGVCVRRKGRRWRRGMWTLPRWNICIHLSLQVENAKNLKSIWIRALRHRLCRDFNQPARLCFPLHRCHSSHANMHFPPVVHNRRTHRRGIIAFSRWIVDWCKCN